MNRIEILNNLEEKMLQLRIDLGNTYKYGSTMLLIGQIIEYEKEIYSIRSSIKIEKVLINFPDDIYGLIGEYL